MSNSNIITPWLPQNLESLHKHEEELRTQSIREINTDCALKEHVIIIQESLNMIHDITKVYATNDNTELTIQCLGARLFNSIVTSINLMLSGYYQSSVMLQRDIVEIGFLLDYFLRDKYLVTKWTNTSTKTQHHTFSPSTIRKKLDKMDGFKGQKRREIYSLMSESTHPSYKGLQLLAPDGNVHLGPFFDATYLKHLVNELALRVPHFTIVYISHFKKLPVAMLKLKSDYLLKLQDWVSKYLNLAHTQDIKSQLEEIKSDLERIIQLK
jgi:hypothetical protein